MQRQIKQSFVISILVHAGFVGLAVFFVLFEAWLDKPEPVVFELLAPSMAPAPAVEQQQPTEEAPPIEPLKIDQADPMEPVPSLPDLPEPEPEPVKKLSYEEWARNRELPERVQRVQRQRSQPVENVPEIETDVRSRLEKQLSAIQIQGVDMSQVDNTDALQRYLAALRQQIQRAFQPSGSDLEAEAYFTVTASGRLTSARIHRSSGNSAFDESVLRTLRTARAPGAPPGNRSYEFSLVFRSE